MKYRSEIDGLRALAVIPVIFFHAGFTLFSGGFLGVDIFFVISGYLITGIILDEMKKGSFSLLNFYERRIRRILPALFFVCFICIPLAWFSFLPIAFKDFSQSILTVNLFTSNFLFWRESGYFGPITDLKPLLHTWSLAVEEQFYLVFPLLLLLLRKVSARVLISIIVILSTLSLILSEFMGLYDPVANFFLLPTRAWELGVGALLAISIPTWKPIKQVVAQILSITGLIMVSYSIFFFNKSTPIPGIYGLVPVLGTGLILAYANNQSLVGKLLGHKFFVGIGLISYSTYLWHQPIFAFARTFSLNTVTATTYWILIPMSLFFGFLTWKYIEKPFRNRSNFNRKQIFTGAALISILFIGFGLYGHFKGGIPSRMSKTIAIYDEFTNDKPLHSVDCLIKTNEPFKIPNEKCIFNPQYSLNTVVWGDSHADSIVDMFVSKISKYNSSVIELAYAACPPLVGFKVSHEITECHEFNTLSLDYILNSEVKIVVLLARWTIYLEGSPFNNQEGGIESGDQVYGLPIDKDNDFILDENRVPVVGELYRRTIQGLLKSGKKVVLIYPVPEVAWNVPMYLAKSHLFNANKKEPLSTSYTVFKERSANAYEQLDLLGQHKNLLRIYPEKVFCNTLLEGRCLAELDSKPLYFDDDHLNSIGSAMLAKEIIRHLEAKGWIE